MEELEWIREAAEEIRKRRAKAPQKEIIRRAEEGDIESLREVISNAKHCGKEKEMTRWLQKFSELLSKKISEGDGIGVYQMLHRGNALINGILRSFYRERLTAMSEQAVTLLEKQLQRGDEEARGWLDRCYCREISDGKRSIDDAIGLWKELAESGNADAEYSISSIYASFTEDEDAAHEWLERSARHGNALAQYGMAEGYITVDEEKNEYIGKEAKKAIPWLEKAAEQCDTAMGKSAMLWLGDIYKFGCREGGIRVDYKKAIYWYTLAAQYGDCFDKRKSLIKLAYCYKKGRGTNRNTKKAAIMFEALEKEGLLTEDEDD